MGYGASSRGGGGSGNAGGGKKKQRGGKKPRSRNFKVKGKTTAATAAGGTPPAPAFTVQEPDPEQRARLLVSRQHGEQLVTAANDRRRRPVNGTSTGGSVLGSATSVSSAGSALVAADNDIANNQIMLGEQEKQQQQHQQQHPQKAQPLPTEQEARHAFLATQEAKMEAVHRHREQTINAKRRAAQLQQGEQFALEISLAKQQWDALAARLDVDQGGNESLNNIRRLLEIVLRNAATKSDPKYKVLRASNPNLWMRLLQFQEVLVILVKGAGFEKRTDVTNKRKETEATRIKMERDRINMEISQALDDASVPTDAIASLISDLDALEIEAAEQQQPATDCVEDDNDKARDFELCHAGAGGDGLGVKRILALLQALVTW